VAIAQAQAEQLADDELDLLLAELDQLSDAEAQTLLVGGEGASEDDIR
jgi:hypothetical protein